jgi:hypothetical protein
MIPEYFAYLSLLFGFIGTFVYIRDTIYGKTRPNRISWLFWSIAPLVGIYISYKSGIEIPLLISTFTAGFFPFIIFISSFLNKNSYWKINKFDILCGLLSFIAIIIWVTTKDGAISLVFAILADLFASIPTIVKSWNNSDTENITPYSFGILNQIITFLIITNFSFFNLAFPIYFVIINIIIILSTKKKLFIQN